MPLNRFDMSSESEASLAAPGEDSEALATSTNKRSLGGQAARGAKTVIIGQIVRMVIQIGSVMVLARLLDPASYGLVAISLAIVGIGEIFRDFGLSTAAVQARHLSKFQRDNLFWINTGIGAGLAVLCVCAAPLVADLFGHEELRVITAALALTFLINGAAAQFRADLNRKMRFGALVASDLLGQFLGVPVAVIIALQGGGFWALIGQQLVGAAASLILAVLLAGWLPGRPRREADVRPMFRFGIGLVGAQMVGYANSNVDTLVIGLRFSATQLGYYNRGYQLLMRPLGQLRAPTTNVALPVLSRLADDRERTFSFLLGGQLALGYTLVAATALAAGTATPLIDIFLGDEWTQVAPIFAFLAIAGCFQTISYVGSWVYLAQGLTGQLFWYSLTSLAIKVVCVLVGSEWGINGVAAGFALAPALSWPLSIWWLGRLTPMPTRGLYGGAVRTLACAALSGTGAWVTVEMLSGSSSLTQLLAGTAVAAAAYGAFALVSSPVRRDLADVISLARR